MSQYAIISVISEGIREKKHIDLNEEKQVFGRYTKHYKISKFIKTLLKPLHYKMYFRRSDVFFKITKCILKSPDLKSGNNPMHAPKPEGKPSSTVSATGVLLEVSKALSGV